MLPLKVAVHLLCVAPVLWLVHFCTSARLFLNADPVKFITHFTGDWAMYILLASTAMSIFGNLAAPASWLIPFHRLSGLYAFFYATLHLAIYLFVYSGYDLIGTFADFRIGQLGTLLVEWNAVSPVVFEDLGKRPFIDVGLFGWVILLVVAVTSQGFIRRALGGKKSQYLDRLTYAAAIAAVIHLCWLTKALVKS
jgi:sulfoxide reductase heme-binding subunit YedZ